MSVRMKYRAFSTELAARTTITRISFQSLPLSTAAAAKSSLEENPANMGMPIMENPAAPKKNPVLGSRSPLPCRFLKSRLSPEASASRGVVRKSRDFVTEWARIWKSAAV